MKEKDELVETTASFLKRVETSEVLDAYEFARVKHAGQFRIGGEDYICHVVRVALAVAKHAAASNISSAKTMIISALLHDVVEDTEATLAEVIQLFGEDVGRIVNALSHEDEEEPDEVYLQRVANGGKLAILVKRFDKLDNIRSLSQAPTECRNGKITENREALAIWRRIDLESAVLIEQALKEVQDERHHPSAS